MAIAGHDDLLFELDTLSAVFGADETLDTDDHVLLEFPIGAVGLPVDGPGNGRPFVAHADAIKARGVDTVACIAVNDAFVMGAWGEAQSAGEKVRMLADGSGDLAKAMDVELDLASHGLGVRSARYSMILDDGVVTAFNLEEGGAFEVSSAEKILEQL